TARPPCRPGSVPKGYIILKRYLIYLIDIALFGPAATNQQGRCDPLRCMMADRTETCGVPDHLAGPAAGADWPLIREKCTVAGAHGTRAVVELDAAQPGPGPAADAVTDPELERPPPMPPTKPRAPPAEPEIDPEFEQLIPPLAPGELAELEAGI